MMMTVRRSSHTTPAQSGRVGWCGYRQGSERNTTAKRSSGIANRAIPSVPSMRSARTVTYGRRSRPTAHHADRGWCSHMSHIREYIGCKSIEAADYDGKGNDLCNMWVTDEEIVRCHDCMKSREKGWKCTRFTEEVYDEEKEIGELVMANVRPDGFCKWGERST